MTVLFVPLVFHKPAIAQKISEQTKHHKISAEVVVSDLNNPWAIVPAPDGRFYITETGGTIRILEGGKLSPSLQGIPAVAEVGQGGLLDLAFHPDFKKNQFVYLAYTVAPENKARTRISRFRLDGNRLTDMHPILADGAIGTDGAHFGCRLVFAKDGKLYATLGERHQRDLAQNLGQLHGKVLRFNDDGSIPKDNPFFNTANARKEVFSYGHRNPQGLDMHPETGELYVTEHGPSGNDAPGGGDEINLLIAGANFGWPVVHHEMSKQGMVSPIKEYTPALAPSGSVFYKGDKLPAWKNDYFFANLRGESLMRVRLSGATLVEEEKLLKGKFGRLRDVANGADGNLYVLSQEGQVIRVSIQ